MNIEQIQFHLSCRTTPESVILFTTFKTFKLSNLPNSTHPTSWKIA